MRILKALVVDDETPARNWLRRLLSEQPQIEIIAEADGVGSAREYLRSHSVDVVFLDVQMPPFTGFDLLPDLPPECQIIFVTAYDEFAVRAFESNALDYLLKPVHPERLANTIGRLLSRDGLAKELPHIVSDNLALGESTLRLQDLLPLKDRHVLRMVSVSAISAIQAQGAYTRIYISGLPPLMILCAIGDWEARLPSPPFARLDRSLIVNLTNIHEAVTIDRNQTQLALCGLDSTFELGRAASQRLRFLLGQSTQPSIQATD
jgi:two-component system, LytTR family, response regulator